MRRASILLALAALVWAPGAFGQCGCDEALHGQWDDCCPGSHEMVFIDVCTNLGHGCLPIVNSIPCSPALRSRRRRLVVAPTPRARQREGASRPTQGAARPVWHAWRNG